MLTDFFYRLRKVQIPVSITEFLTLMAALEARVAGFSVDDFYYLARATLVKDERFFDRFDQVFGEYVRGQQTLFEEILGEIPLEWRSAIGNRIYGCDDCQLACPWNKFAQAASLPDFKAREQLDTAGLIALFAWDEARFLRAFEGSAIRRIGHGRWLRNIAVALGNAPSSPQVIEALRSRADDPDALVAQHVRWALEQHAQGGTAAGETLGDVQPRA